MSKLSAITALTHSTEPAVVKEGAKLFEDLFRSVRQAAKDAGAVAEQCLTNAGYAIKTKVLGHPELGDCTLLEVSLKGRDGYQKKNVIITTKNGDILHKRSTGGADGADIIYNKAKVVGTGREPVNGSRIFSGDK
jgi:hypothetical protein